MEVIAIEKLGDGVLAWLRSSSYDRDIELYLEEGYAQICYYPGWERLDRAEQRNLVAEMLTDLCRAVVKS